MASQSNVQHHFDGDGKLLTTTLNRRMELRKVLAALQQDFAHYEGRPTQLTAEIRFHHGRSDAKENVYSITITDAGFDVSALTHSQPNLVSKPNPEQQRPRITSPGLTGADPVPGSRQKPLARRSVDSDEVLEVRPFKKPRSGGDDVRETSERGDELMSFIKGWHREWTQQGGWLFDTVNRTTSSLQLLQPNVTATEQRLGEVQDVLGRSINAANASTISELEEVKKLIPWLEQCRKVNAEKVQAREEKWRSSSATFHDQARRDREAAEKRLEDKLDAQARLLTRLARAGGLDLDDPDDSSEGSLGAQLTAELSLEAARAGTRNYHDAISLDDDDQTG